MDIKLDATGDISFSGGESSITTIGADDLAQRLQIRLKTHLGEWFMDTSVGVDWLNRVFGKNRNKNAIDALIQAEILREPDVLQIVSYSSTVSNDRRFSCTFSVRTENGAISVVFALTPPV